MERNESESREVLQGLEVTAQRSARGWSIALALVTSGIHLLTNGQYGFFRDELYYLDCARHLDWGYPDMAPFAPAAARFATSVLGDSLRSLRFLPAICSALLVLLTGALVRELKGGRCATILACLAVMAAPVYLVNYTLFSLNAFEPLFWMAAVWCVLRASNSGDTRWMTAAGALLGAGLMNKHSTAFFGVCLAAGLALSPQRRLLLSRHALFGAAAAFVLFLPNLIWQVRHDFATLELLQNVRRTGKNVELGPLAFTLQQVMMMLPGGALLWMAGLWSRKRHFVGLAFAIFFLLMMAMHAKDYYVAPAYPMLLAAGAVWWEARAKWARWLAGTALVAFGLVAAPIALPVLPPDQLQSYLRGIGIAPQKSEVHHDGPLPQHFSDQFGWPEMVEQVAGIFHRLPPEERRVARVLAGNYGEAGAINKFGPRYGLPPAISGHQGHIYWGYGDATGEVLILLQWPREAAERNCASVGNAGRTGHPWAMREEHYDILICRGLKTPMREFFPKLKHWN
jgi:hypothetical protein